MSSLTQDLHRLLMSSNCSAAEVSALVEQGADSLAQNVQGTTLLMLAINRRCGLNIIRSLFLRSPAKCSNSLPDPRVNAINHDGDSALSLGVLVYDGPSAGELFEVLRGAGADFSFRPSAGRSIVSMALRNKYSLRQIRYFLECGTCVEGSDVGEAIKLSRLDVAGVLLNSYNCSNVEGPLPLANVLPNGLSLLVKHFDPRKGATSGQLTRLFKRLVLEFELDINYSDTFTLPVLHMLIIKWKKALNGPLDSLLSRPNLNVDITTNNSKSPPLTLALNQGLNRIAEKLILAHADVQKANVQNMLLCPGLSCPLKLLHLHGYKIPETFGHLPGLSLNIEEDGAHQSHRNGAQTTTRPSRRDHSRHLSLNELINLKEWLKSRPAAFPSLKTLAAKKVRPLHANYVSLFGKLNYPSHLMEKFTRLVFLDIC